MRCTAKHEHQATHDILCATDPWAAAMTALRASPAPYASAAFGALYTLVCRDGRRVLRTFRQIDDDRKDDIALDTLVTALPALLRADCARAYFATALHRAVVSWLRSPRATVAELVVESTRDAGYDGDAESCAHRRIAAREAFEALRGLNSRDRAVMLAEARGDSRDEIAAALGMSRANVDQVISRVRRAMRDRWAA